MAISIYPKSLGQLGGTPRWYPVGARFRGVPGTGGNVDNTNTCVNDTQMFQAPNIPGCAIKALRVGFAGFDQPLTGPVDRVASVTGGACALVIPTTSPMPTSPNGAAVAAGATTISFNVNLQYPMNGVSQGQTVGCSVANVIAPGTYVTQVTWGYSGQNVTSLTVTLSTPTVNTTTFAVGGGQFYFGGEVYPFTFGGKRSNLYVDPRRDFVFSDPLPIAIPCDGRQIVIKTATQFSGPIGQISDFVSSQNTSLSTRLTASGGLTESSTRAASYTDLTVSAATPPGNSGAGFWGPHLILAQLTQPQPAVVVIGDSIAQGAGDNTDAAGRVGYVPKSLGVALPWYTLARGQTTAREAAQSEMGSRGFHAAAYHCSATDVLILLGRNDIAAEAYTASQLKTDVASLAAPYLAEGVRVRAGTIPPTTCSTDSWTSAANQFWPLGNSTLTAAAVTGATTITISNASGFAVGQPIALYGAVSGLLASNATVSVTSGTVLTLSAATTGALAAGTTLSCGGQIVTLTQAAASGATTLTVAGTSGVANGSSIALLSGAGGFFAAGTTITALSGTTLTLSAALLQPLPSGTAVISGTSAPSGLSNEVQRLAYNSDLRANWASYGYSGLIDVAAVLEDVGANASKWISTGGQAYTFDGVHPSPTGHAALVGAGVIPLGAFSLS